MNMTTYLVGGAMLDYHCRHACGARPPVLTRRRKVSETLLSQSRLLRVRGSATEGDGYRGREREARA